MPSGAHSNEDDRLQLRPQHPSAMLSFVLNERVFQALIILCFLFVVIMIYAHEASVSLKVTYFSCRPYSTSLLTEQNQSRQVWLTVQELPPPPRIDYSGSAHSKSRKELDSRISYRANQSTLILLLLVFLIALVPLSGLFEEEPQSIDARTRLGLVVPLIFMSARVSHLTQ